MESASSSSQLRGTETLICQPVMQSREVCYLPGAKVQDAAEIAKIGKRHTPLPTSFPHGYQQYGTAQPEQDQARLQGPEVTSKRDRGPDHLLYLASQRQGHGSQCTMQVIHPATRS